MMRPTKAWHRVISLTSALEQSCLWAALTRCPSCLPGLHERAERMGLQLEESLFAVVGCKSNVTEQALERLSRCGTQ